MTRAEQSAYNRQYYLDRRARGELTPNLKLGYGMMVCGTCPDGKKPHTRNAHALAELRRDVPHLFLPDGT